jgi:hypothetical protein
MHERAKFIFACTSYFFSTTNLIYCFVYVSFQVYCTAQGDESDDERKLRWTDQKRPEGFKNNFSFVKYTATTEMRMMNYFTGTS